eukprot:tig00020539_g10409.t1
MVECEPPPDHPRRAGTMTGKRSSPPIPSPSDDEGDDAAKRGRIVNDESGGKIEDAIDSMDVDPIPPPPRPEDAVEVIFDGAWHPWTALESSSEFERRGMASTFAVRSNGRLRLVRYGGVETFVAEGVRHARRRELVVRLRSERYRRCSLAALLRAFPDLRRAARAAFRRCQKLERWGVPFTLEYDGALGFRIFYKSITRFREPPLGRRFASLEGQTTATLPSYLRVLPSSVPAPASVETYLGAAAASVQLPATRIDDYRALGSDERAERVLVRTGEPDDGSCEARADLAEWLLPEVVRYAGGLGVPPAAPAGRTIELDDAERARFAVALGLVAGPACAELAAAPGRVYVDPASVRVEAWVNSIEYRARLPCPACGRGDRWAELTADSVRERVGVRCCGECEPAIARKRRRANRSRYPKRPLHSALKALRQCEVAADEARFGNLGRDAVERREHYMDAARFGATANRAFEGCGTASAEHVAEIERVAEATARLFGGEGTFWTLEGIAEKWATLNEEERRKERGALRTGFQLPEPGKMDDWMRIIVDPDVTNVYVDDRLIHDAIARAFAEGYERVYVVLEEGMGAGKSTAILRSAAEVVRDPTIANLAEDTTVSIAWFVNSRSHPDQLKERNDFRAVFRGLVDKEGREVQRCWIGYREERKAGSDAPDALLVTAESSHRFVQGASPYHILVIDEVGKIAAIISSSGTLAKDLRQAAAAKALARMLAAARVVYLADADLDRETLRFVLDMGNSEPRPDVNASEGETAAGTRTTRGWRSRGGPARRGQSASSGLRVAALLLLGYKVIVSSTTKDEFNAICAVVDSHPDLAHVRRALVCGNSDDRDRRLFSDPNRFAELDLICYNTAVAQGSSMDEPHVLFDVCCVVHGGVLGDVNIQYQLTPRCRAFSETLALIFCPLGTQPKENAKGALELLETRRAEVRSHRRRERRDRGAGVRREHDNGAFAVATAQWLNPTQENALLRRQAHQMANESHTRRSFISSFNAKLLSRGSLGVVVVDFSAPAGENVKEEIQALRELFRLHVIAHPVLGARALPGEDVSQEKSAAGRLFTARRAHRGDPNDYERRSLDLAFAAQAFCVAPEELGARDIVWYLQDPNGKKNRPELRNLLHALEVEMGGRPRRARSTYVLQPTFTDEAHADRSFRELLEMVRCPALLALRHVVDSSRAGAAPVADAAVAAPLLRIALSEAPHDPPGLATSAVRVGLDVLGRDLFDDATKATLEATISVEAGLLERNFSDLPAERQACIKRAVGVGDADDALPVAAVGRALAKPSVRDEARALFYGSVAGQAPVEVARGELEELSTMLAARRALEDEVAVEVFRTLDVVTGRLAPGERITAETVLRIGRDGEPAAVEELRKVTARLLVAPHRDARSLERGAAWRERLARLTDLGPLNVLDPAGADDHAIRTEIERLRVLGVGADEFGRPLACPLVESDAKGVLLNLYAKAIEHVGLPFRAKDTFGAIARATRFCSDSLRPLSGTFPTLAARLGQLNLAFTVLAAAATVLGRAKKRAADIKAAKQRAHDQKIPYREPPEPEYPAENPFLWLSAEARASLTPEDGVLCDYDVRDVVHRALSSPEASPVLDWDVNGTTVRGAVVNALQCAETALQEATNLRIAATEDDVRALCEQVVRWRAEHGHSRVLAEPYPERRGRGDHILVCRSLFETYTCMGREPTVTSSGERIGWFLNTSSESGIAAVTKWQEETWKTPPQSAGVFPPKANRYREIERAGRRRTRYLCIPRQCFVNVGVALNF